MDPTTMAAFILLAVILVALYFATLFQYGTNHNIYPAMTEALSRWCSSIAGGATLMLILGIFFLFFPDSRWKLFTTAPTYS